eukprot:2587649-Rhodomonas_salina.1
MAPWSRGYLRYADAVASASACSTERKVLTPHVVVPGPQPGTPPRKARPPGSTGLLRHTSWVRSYGIVRARSAVSGTDVGYLCYASGTRFLVLTSGFALQSPHFWYKLYCQSSTSCWVMSGADARYAGTRAGEVKAMWELFQDPGQSSHFRTQSRRTSYASTGARASLQG